jgi:hypothetical protein
MSAQAISSSSGHTRLRAQVQVWVAFPNKQATTSSSSSRMMMRSLQEASAAAVPRCYLPCSPVSHLF